jgi:hypothetical protein
MIITEVGNVGIGSLSPAYKLDVSGNMKVNSLVVMNNLSFDPSANSIKNDLQIQPIRLSTYATTGQTIFTLTKTGTFTATAQNVQVFKGRQPLFYYTSTIKDYDVSITYNSNITNFVVTLMTPANSGDYIDITVWPQLTQPDANISGYVYQQVNITDPVWKFTPSSSNIYFNTGNVGVGTNFATSGFHIQNSIVKVDGKNLGAGEYLLDLNAGVSGNNTLIRGKSTLGSNMFIFDTSSNNTVVSLYDGANNSKIRLDTSSNSYITGGNLGVGTTNPLATLHVQGSIRASGGVTVGGSIAPDVSGSLDLGTSVNRWSNLYVNTINANTVSGTYNMAGTFVYDNIGISTNTPRAALDVSGSAIITNMLTVENRYPARPLGGVFDNPVYFWEGLTALSAGNEPLTRITLVGSTTRNTAWETTTAYNQGYRFHYRAATISQTNGAPTNYVRIELPVTTTVDNAFFVLTSVWDRWQSIHVRICDPSNSLTPTVLLSSRTNSIRNGSGVSSWVGPNNVVANPNRHLEWFQYSLPLDLVNTYKTATNTVHLALHFTTYGQITASENLFIAGLAMCPNPYGVTVKASVDVASAFSSGGATIPLWSSHPHQWNNETLIQMNNNTTFTNLRVPITSTSRAIYLGIVMWGDTWVPYTHYYTVNGKIYHPNPYEIGRYGIQVMSRQLFRHAYGVVISATDVAAAAVTVSGSYYLNFTLRNIGETTYIRGFYTEYVTI